MKLLVDMNLSPRWVGFLATHAIEAQHWSQVGDPRASDATIMKWALERGCVVFTHDLDFSTILALAGATGPSVLQVRTHDVLPEAIGSDVVRILKEHADALDEGAVITIDETVSRVRILPIRRAPIEDQNPT
jgi:predicted nuclease of predicted toxin-antitoxin system